MIEKIIISDTVIIYKSRLDYNKEALLKEIYYNVDVNPLALDIPSPESPGIQAPISVTTPEIERIFDSTLSIFKENFNLGDYYYHRPWLFISNRDNLYSNYHKHDTFANINLKNIKWTYTFYVQMPDNLKENDGYLYFKTDNGIEHSVLPQEGDLIIFPGSLAHRPETNKNSTVDRVVLAAMVTPIDLKESFKKREKSLI